MKREHIMNVNKIADAFRDFILVLSNESGISQKDAISGIGLREDLFDELFYKAYVGRMNNDFNVEESFHSGKRLHSFRGIRILRGHHSLYDYMRGIKSD